MSRIDDALKRITGGGAEPRPASAGLDRYAPEKGGTRPDESKLAAFAAAGPVPVERPQQKAAAPALPAPVQVVVPVQADANADGESEKLIDFRPVIDYVVFLGGAVWRHKGLATAAFIVPLSLIVVLAMMLPKTYWIDTQLLAQRNAVMTALSNPGRAVPWDADAPTRAASETIVRRDNLIALIQQTDLMNEWERTRIPILRFKDWLMSFTRRPLTQEEKLDQMIDLLAARFVVVAGQAGDGTVTIGLSWPDAQMGYRIVDAAQRAFIEDRQKAERAAIRESIGILETYSNTLHQNINDTLAELERTRARSRTSSGSTARAQAPPQIPAAVTALLPPIPAAAREIPAVGADLDDPQIPRLKATLASRRQDIANLEDSRQRQLSDLQAQLERLTTIYTPAHPAVLSVQQNIAALSRDTPQLAALKAQVDSLETDYDKRVTAVAEMQQVDQLRAEYANRDRSVRAPAAAQEARVSGGSDLPGTGETGDYASIRLRLELNQLESVLERTDGARIELAVSDAAFKYRYSVIRPPQVPRQAAKPDVSLIVAAGLVGSLLFALAAVAGMDLLSGRIFVRWQVERNLGLPILGTLGTS